MAFLQVSECRLQCNGSIQLLVCPSILSTLIGRAKQDPPNHLGLDFVYIYVCIHMYISDARVSVL